MAWEDDLFTALPLSRQTPAKKDRKTFVGSLIVHVGTLAALILVPLLAPVELPDAQHSIRVLLYNPPPAAAAPLPKGSSLVRKIEPPKKVAEKPVEKPKDPEKPKFVAPVIVPTATPEPEERVAAKDQYGSEAGSDTGIAEGMEGGIEGGIAGGILGGVVGGCVGCTGDGPVLDYDEPPRMLKQTRPVYPQEAFVKKIEGNVPVEILIDANGNVVRAKVLRSVPALDKAALECVRQWLFAPATKKGRAVATLAQASVTFRIF